MRFRKRPIEIDAIHLGADLLGLKLETFLRPRTVSDFAVFTHTDGVVARVEILTLEGMMTAFPGDWIIVGVAREAYPCGDKIFRETYDRAHELNCARPHTLEEGTECPRPPASIGGPVRAVASVKEGWLGTPPDDYKP